MRKTLEKNPSMTVTHKTHIQKIKAKSCLSCRYGQLAKQVLWDGAIYGLEKYRCFHDGQLHKKYDSCPIHTLSKGAGVVHSFIPVLTEVRRSIS